MITEVNPSILGLDNKGIEDIFFTEAYNTFLEYLNEQSITCFNYVDDNNTDSKKANITEVPIKEYSFHYIYADLYKQKDKDIIDLFGRMIKLSCREINYLRSAHHFLNDLYEDKLTLGKPKLYNFSIIFELDYIKIACEDSVFNLSVKNNEILIIIDDSSVKIDRLSSDINEEFNYFIQNTLTVKRQRIKQVIGSHHLDAKYICNRMNKSLTEIYNEAQFKGYTIKCPYKTALENGFKHKVQKTKYGHIYYKTSAYNEAVILINNYLDDNYAKKCLQLINLTYFMNNIENDNWSFLLKLQKESKYKLEYEDILEFKIVIKNIDITIGIGDKNTFFKSHYSISNIGKTTERIYEQDNDLNNLYMAIINEFRKRIAKTCEIDEKDILKEHLDIYRMHQI